MERLSWNGSWQGMLLATWLGLILLWLSPSSSLRAEETVNISKVEFATVFNVRRLSQQDLVADQRRGWSLFRNAWLGGALGYRYNIQASQDIGSVLDAVLQHNKSRHQQAMLVGRDEISLVELIVTRKNGKQNTIILQFRAKDIYRPKDEIRLVHFDMGVFVDKLM